MILIALLISCMLDQGFPALDRSNIEAMEAILKWEFSSKNIASYSSDLVVTTTDKNGIVLARQFGYIDSLGGDRIRLDLWRASEVQNGINRGTVCVLNGMIVHSYDLDHKYVISYRLPFDYKWGAVYQSVFGKHTFLTIMPWPAAICCQRISSQAVADRFYIAVNKSDNQTSISLILKPKFDSDRNYISSILIKLQIIDNDGREVYVPRVITIRKAKGENEEQWDFNKIVINRANIAINRFNYQEPPAGWRKDSRTLPK